MQKEVYNQLHQDEPPPRDIFTVFRENHPETLFELDPPANPNPVDFSRKTEVGLRSGEGVTEPNSILKYIKDRAVISDANKAVADTIDVNACLKDHNWEGAEHILGRPLTNEEKQAQMVKEQQAPLVDQAQHQLRLEELKGRIKEAKKKRKALLAKWKAIGDKARKAAIAAEIARVDAEMADHYAGIADIFRDDDDDDDAGLGGLDDEDNDDEGFFDDSGLGKEELDSIARAVFDKIKKGKDGEEKEDDVESIASTVLDKRKKGKDGEDDVESIASTVLDKDKKRGKAIVNTIEVPPLDPDQDYSIPDLKQRAIQLRDLYPELKVRGTGILSSVSGTKDEIRVRIEAAEKWIDKKRDQERDSFQTPERRQRSFEPETPEKRRLKLGMEIADDILASPEIAAAEPLPRPQGGLGVFTGLLKKKNEHDYIKWNDRFVINLKRLKDKGTFALFYPGSGQPHNQIKTAHLTPALKEIVLAYLNKEPQDTTNLTPEELKWLKNVWQLSGVTKPAPKLRIAPKLYKGKADMRSRLKEIMGISLAGNDNPELMVEMAKLVDRLEDKGWMSKEEIINSRRFISGME